MSDPGEEQRRCTTCGSPAGADDIYCRFCGSRLPVTQQLAVDDPEASTETEVPEIIVGSPPDSPQDELTRRSPTVGGPSEPYGDPQSSQFGTTTPEQSGAAQQPFAPPQSFAPAPPPAQRDSKIWWILGAAVAVFLLICCCLLILIGVTASQDSGLREELQSMATVLVGFKAA